MPELTRSIERDRIDPGPYFARVINHLDPKYMGSLNVQLLRDIGNQPNTLGQIIEVKYLPPFYGVTGLAYNSANDDYNSTQKSYGMWMIPPDPGTIVLVIFVEGAIKNGYWIGCVQDQFMNFMIPGIAATTFNSDGEKKPVAEYNKKVIGDITSDTTKIKKPVHPFYETLKKQGLEKDEIRGYTTSSARREVPSAVFGISTPGPLDRKGPKGYVGSEQTKAQAFVSRLGGSTFVMDDGDINFLRKTKPNEGPPEYASVEDGESGVDDLPHNELIRIRTRTGHQIVLHNSEDLIYIANSKGTAWIEFTSDGKIDIYAEDSVSLRTKKDLNFYADRDINIEAKRNLNIKVAEEMHTHVEKDQILMVDGDQKILIKKNVNYTVEQDQKTEIKKNLDLTIGENLKETIKADLDLTVTGHNWMTSTGPTEVNAGASIIMTGSQIHMNGPTAQQATKATAPTLPKKLKLHTIPDENGGKLAESIMRRIPTHEPWPHHENLDPKKFKEEKIDRDIEGRYEGTSDSINIKPAQWKKELSVDTFKKIGK